ncbi:uncharacterized protein BX664DRAFT_136703 [Halteromyces radiatus]|uniref:uncharacterized protein n=1 Tax=Halteromyces radiatus TaxID=101107 RepID=UPI002220FE33|nr:uncharacterized protein BX664DRAFT_136703 [Halteromyces radiatus]KAI8089551.1 hypothetical protein BX664DRAFT_136703 [Halteromyces radiatus]
MTLTSKERVDKPMDHHFAIRKISSEDDVGIIPYTPNVVSVYADSIRRQRSDSFVHSYNNNNRITGTTKIATAKTTTAKTTTTKTTTNTTLQTRTLSIRRPIHIDLKHEEVDSEDDQEKQTVYLDYNNNITRSRSNSNNTNNSFQNSVGNSLHINTSLSTPGNTNKNDTGAILEGVLIRRAIRPSSHLTQQQANKEDSLSSSPKDGLNLSSPSSSASSPSSMTETVTPSVLPSSSTSTPISIPDSSIPWQPPSLTIPTHNNTNNTAISSLDNENTMSSVVSKLIPRKEKQMDDYTKHPSLFKRLAHIHHHNHYGPKLYRDDHLYENMLMSPSNTTSIDQDTEL